MMFTGYIGPTPAREVRPRRGNHPSGRAFLCDRHVRLVRALRAELIRWLPELENAPAGVVDALDLATSFEAWDRLRSDQGLARARAQAAVEQTSSLS